MEDFSPPPYCNSGTELNVWKLSGPLNLHIIIFISLSVLLPSYPPVQAKYHGDDSSSEEAWPNGKINGSDVGLSPPVFNLARHAHISANGTCGERGDETYCKLVEHVHNRPPRPSQCQVCNADSPDKSKRHPIRYAIDESNRWWQSPTLANGREYEWITITIDLKKVYQVAYIIIKAAISPRPGNWILERSLDGIDFLPWQYFATSDDECWTRYGVPGKVGKPSFADDDEVICTSYFSKITPFEGGEIHVSLVNGRPGAETMSEKLTKFTMGRYIRLRLQKIRTLHGDLMTMSGSRAWDTSVMRRYFYSIKDIAIGGTCVCFGHASQCVTHEDGTTPTAKCMCQHNTCGDNCDVCCPLFNQYQWGPGNSSDSAACEECQCYGHADSCVYDPHVHEKRLSINTFGTYDGGGVCLNCKAHTAGYNCEKCQEGYYRPRGVPIDDPTPCVKCNCSSLGSVGYCVPSEVEALPLGKNPGDCICKEGYGGKYCDQCLRGFKGYPKCVPCPCNLAGIANEDCEGDCVCKDNVEGGVCNACKKGYFNLNPANPEGCTQCFCHGVAKDCTSSNFAVRKIHNITAWSVTDLHGTKVVAAVDSGDGAYHVANEEFGLFSQYYWTANDAFSGKRILSYGLNVQCIVSWIQARGDTSGRFIQDYDVIVQSSNAMLAFGHNTHEGSNATVQVVLSETNCVILPDIDNNVVQRSNANNQARPCTRYEVMESLSDVKRILFRAKFHTDQIEGMLHNATFEMADPHLEILPGTKVASSVEVCACPPGYSGTSCENCDRGYRKSSRDSWLNECVQCDCHGHSDCDFEGNCLECQHNTTGSRCESCLEGFHGNPKTDGERSCKPCECPLGIASNNFSPTCEATTDSYRCTKCPAGYTGPYCERCDSGYYGNPTEPGDTCKPCNCNSATTKNGSRTPLCDHLTGECLLCPPNTVGWNCDECTPGHYGNPLLGTCTACDCDPLGSIGSNCDLESGQCYCRENFEGRKCDRCMDGHGSPKEGCPSCDCNVAGSLSHLCDKNTGQCSCRPGVGGRYCNHCVDLHFGFGPNGCQPCSCHPEGSDSATCDLNTGECHCLPNVKGRTCSSCVEGYWNLDSGKGCQRCGCDSTGSEDPHCNLITGQCRCKPGVGGLRCDACSDGFFGFSSAGCRACDPCDKPGYVCDEHDGRCRCPPNTEGEACEKCRVGYWGLSVSGCQECNCSHQGSTTPQCSPETGKCTCLPGYDGDQCDMCKFGYYNYPTCTPCECDPEGTISKYCDSNGKCSCDLTGQCICKENVDGKKCDRCKEGTYGLDATNPEGCMKCFCFQRTSRCSEGYFKWTRLALPTDRNIQIRPGEIESKLRGVNNLIVIPDTSETIYIESDISFGAPLYWQLPHIFLGDKVLSYNGYLRFHLSSVSSSSSFPNNVLETYPLVQVTGNYKLILEHYPTTPALNGFFEIKLHEDYWMQKNGTSITPVDKEVMMVALQNLQHIFIRATSSPEVFNVTFYNVSLDIAIPNNEIDTSMAHGIEVCECPPEYNSTSCQNPKLGYYRWYKHEYVASTVIIDLVGEARPCDCNGRADVCHTESGHCLNCSGNTAGPHCERCAPGYYGDAFQECIKCPCPSVWSNHADSCYPDPSGDAFQCFCKNGYTGKTCDRCDYGYYGNPWEPNGHCQPCRCNPYGSVSDECHEITGQCNCRPGVTGRDCSRCSKRHVIIGQRCVSCEDQCTGTLLLDLDLIGTQLSSISVNPGDAAVWRKLLTLDLESKTLLARVAELNTLTVLIEYMPTHTNLGHLFAIRINELRKLNLDDYSVWAPALADRSVSTLKKLEAVSNELNATITRLRAFNEASSGEVEVNSAVVEARQLLREQQAVNFDIIESEVEFASEKAMEAHNLVMATTFDLSAAIALELRLDLFRGKLEDLQLYLKEADEKVKQAEDTMAGGNGYLTTTQRDLESIDNITVNMDMMTMTAVDTLTEGGHLVEDIDQMSLALLDLIRDFSNLTNDLSARERHLLEQIPVYTASYAQPAFEHVRQLEGQARQMQRFLDSVNFSEPLNAVTAYQRIAEGFDEAEEIAIGASFDSVDAAEKIAAIIRGNPLQAMIEETALRIQETLSAIDAKKNGMRKELDELVSDMEVLKWEIRVANETLRGIFNIIEEYDENLRIDELIQRLMDTLVIVDEAYDEAALVAAQIKNEVKTKLEEITGGSLAPVNAAELQRRVDALPDAIQEISSLGSQLEARKFMLDIQEDDMEDKLRRLRAMIAKASHKSDTVRVAIGPDDTGTCFRLYKWLTIDDSTSIKFKFAPTKAADSLLFYWPSALNDDFIAIEMADSKIKVSWDLGSGLRTLIHPMKITTINENVENPDHWLSISVERVGSTVSLSVQNVGKPKKDSKIVHQDPEDSHTLLNHSPDDLIHIGGMSKQARPGLVPNGLSGCIHQLVVNDRSVGLWNFVGNEGCAPCTECLEEADKIISTEPDYHFDGRGYALVHRSETNVFNPQFFDLAMEFKTFSETSLLFFTINDSDGQMISVEIKEGIVVMQVRHDWQDSTDALKIEANAEKVNNGKWVKVRAAWVSQRGTQIGQLTVGSKTYKQDKKSPGQDLNQFNVSYQIGGLAPEYSATKYRRLVSSTSFVGCIKNVVIDSMGYDLLSGFTYGVEPSCRGKAEYVTSFEGDGFGEYQAEPMGKEFVMGLSFKTLYPSGILAISTFAKTEASNPEPYYAVYLENGRIRMHFGIPQGPLELNKGDVRYDDGKFHSFRIVKKNRRIAIHIDDEEIEEARLPKKSPIVPAPTKGGLYVGGLSDPIRTAFQNTALKMTRDFAGCIQNLYFGNQLIDFSLPVTFKNQNLALCPTHFDQESTSIPPQFLYPVAISASGIRYERPYVEHSCAASHAIIEQEDPGTSLHFGDSPESYAVLALEGSRALRHSFNMTFQFRTYYPTGLFFKAIKRKGHSEHCLAAYLKDGQVHVKVQGDRPHEISAPVPGLHDGSWHTVTIVKTDEKMFLYLDGTNVAVIKSPRLKTVTKLFIGGSPDESQDCFEDSVHKPSQFKGCMKNFNVNSHALSFQARSAVTHNLNPCFRDVQRGTYFNPGGYAIHSHNFTLGDLVELEMEFRSETRNGLLISFIPQGENKFPKFSIFLNDGQVYARESFGPDDTIQAVQEFPEDTSYVCNGQWHSVKANYDKGAITLKIDSLPPQYAVVPPGTRAGQSSNYFVVGSLFIGGLEEDSSRSSKKNQFHGCIRKVTVNGHRKDWTDMPHLSNVFLNACPL